ncbi:MAG: tRNA (adenosine(37)-N6)-threonylcarbamoyltransferase complex transferase subunit TsaD [Candidatus Micrarchaeota archaeon]
MIVLGIESTAHTLGIGIAENKKGKIKILANSNAKYPVADFIPRKLADHHAKQFKQVLAAALKQACVSLHDIDAFAYSQGPGLGHCLHLGFVGAQTLALEFEKPLIPVNHVVAHIEVVKWACKARDPLVVFVSGGNTQLIAKQGKHYHVFGETLDIGVGNFLDKLGRGLKLNPPDAIGVIKAAGKSRELIELPYTVKGMDLAFSGLLTACLNSKASKNAVAYSAQETAFAMVTEASERALRHADKKELLICGGVAQNKRFVEMMRRMAKDAGSRFLTAPNEFNGDNGGQIALTGLLMAAGGKRYANAEPRQKTRVEDVEIAW